MHWFKIKMLVNDFMEGVMMKISWGLPRSLVYWCVVRVWSAATIVDKDEDVSTMTVVRALELWEDGTR